MPGEPAVQTNRRLRPLEFKLSEGVSKITIKHADSTLTLNPIPDDPATTGDDESADPTGGDGVATVDFLNDTPDTAPWWTVTEETGAVAGIDKGKYEAKGGTAGDIIITAWDSLGNKTEYKGLTGITLDGNTPGITNLFPSDEAAPKDADNEDAPTIDPVTKNPAFIINEELDSLSIRYHESGGGATIVQAYGPGNARLETVGSLVSWPVNDTTFIDRQRYESGGAGDRPRGQRQRDEGRYAHVQGYVYESGRRYVQDCGDAGREAGCRRGRLAGDDGPRYNADACRKGKG